MHLWLVKDESQTALADVGVDQGAWRALIEMVCDVGHRLGALILDRMGCEVTTFQAFTEMRLSMSVG
jgi:hypothetical protein